MTAEMTITTITSPAQSAAPPMPSFQKTGWVMMRRAANGQPEYLSDQGRWEWQPSIAEAYVASNPDVLRIARITGIDKEGAVVRGITFSVFEGADAERIAAVVADRGQRVKSIIVARRTDWIGRDIAGAAPQFVVSSGAIGAVNRISGHDVNRAIAVAEDDAGAFDRAIANIDIPTPRDPKAYRPTYRYSRAVGVIDFNGQV